MNAAIGVIMAAYWIFLRPDKQADLRIKRLHHGLMALSFLMFGLNVLMEQGLLSTLDHLAAAWIRGMGA